MRKSQHLREQFNVNVVKSRDLAYSDLQEHFRLEIEDMTNSQPVSSFTIYDFGFPRTTADTSTPARVMAVLLEDLTRHDSNETGAFFSADGSMIIKKTGQPDRVQFSAAELAGTDGTLFTHNHPDNSPPSGPDIQNAVDQRLVELRAVGPSIRYIMRPLPLSAWPSYLSICTAARHESRHAYLDVQGQVSGGQLSSRFMGLEFHHLVWMRVAQRLGFTYIREAS